MRKAKHLQRPLFCQWSDHRFSKELKKISEILDENPRFAEWVYEDLCEGRDLKDTGANGMTARQVLRAAILKQQNGWSYECLELQCVDSDMTKSFVQLAFGESYSASCLQDNISRIRAGTWYRILEGTVKHAEAAGVEKGRTVRVDSTVVESNIHHPTDANLLYDCIRVVGRALKFFRKEYGIKLYSKVSPKEAKRLTLSIMNAKDKKARKRLYRKLLAGCRKVAKNLPDMMSRIEQSVVAEGDAARQLADLTNVNELLPLIIHQAGERVLREKDVPATEKIVSIFEPHTDVIVKGQREVEFGHKVFLTAGKSGLVLDCQLARGNPADSEFFVDLVERQKEVFGRVPRQTTADGGFASAENVDDAKELGVSDVCFSKRCGLSIEEMVKSKWVFQKLRDFRAGIEGVISVLKRAFGFARATWKGVSGFAAFVHSSVVAYNLTVLSRLLLQKST